MPFFSASFSVISWGFFIPLHVFLLWYTLLLLLAMYTFASVCGFFVALAAFLALAGVAVGFFVASFAVAFGVSVCAACVALIRAFVGTAAVWALLFPCPLR